MLTELTVRYERGTEVRMTIEIVAIHSVFIRVQFNTRAELQKLNRSKSCILPSSSSLIWLLLILDI